MSTPPIATHIADQLAAYLGPFNARIAVKTFAQKHLQLTPEALTADHLPALLDALRPMLNTLVGQASADAVLESIRRGIA